MTSEEVDALIDFLSFHPSAGEEIQGTGGCRKLRVAGRGKGKSGGFRTITFYTGEHSPLYLITVFSKGERSDLSKRECNALAELAANLKAQHGNRVVKTTRKRK